jgi:hypothetical protein
MPRRRILSPWLARHPGTPLKHATSSTSNTLIRRLIDPQLSILILYTIRRYSILDAESSSCTTPRDTRRILHTGITKIPITSSSILFTAALLPITRQVLLYNTDLRQDTRRIPHAGITKILITRYPIVYSNPTSSCITQTSAKNTRRILHVGITKIPITCYPTSPPRTLSTCTTLSSPDTSTCYPPVSHCHPLTPRNPPVQRFLLTLHHLPVVSLSSPPLLQLHQNPDRHLGGIHSPLNPEPGGIHSPSKHQNTRTP